MPEEQQIPTQPTIPSTTKSSGNSFLSFSKLLIIVLIIGIAFVLVYILFLKPKQKESSVVTGLTRNLVTIGITGFTGVFPNNDSPAASDDIQVNDVIFDSLVKMRSDQVVPSIATSWTNPDKNTWRFVIRSGVSFTSGDALTVNDIKYSFDQAIASNANPDTALPSAYEAENVKSVKVVDDHTIDVVTIKPDPIFLLKLLDFYIFSQAQTKRDGMSKAVGTGPYKVTKLVKDKEVDLETNQSYWGEKPKVGKVVYLVFSTNGEMQTAFSKGQIDVGRLRSAKVDVPADYSEITFDEPRVLSLMFNFAEEKIKGQTNPLLKKQVREAVKLGLDQNQVIKEASAAGRPATQLITKSIVGYNPSITYPKKDIVAAKKLLADNGVTNFKMTIYATADKEAAAQSIAAQLADIGITATVSLQSDFGSLVQKVTSGIGEAFVAAPQVNDGGEYLSTILDTKGEQNILTYSNPDLDKIIAQAADSFVPKERKDLLQQGMSLAMADDPILPMYSQTDTILVRDSFALTLTSLGEIHADTISGREIQTTK